MSMLERLPWSSELLTLDGRPTDLLRAYVAPDTLDPEREPDVDTH